MPLTTLVFLILVIAAFAGYGIVLFVAWLSLEVFGKPVAPVSNTHTREAERPKVAA